MIKVLLIILIIFSIRCPAWCQTSCNCKTSTSGEISYLRAHFSKSKQDTTQLKMLHKLGNYYLTRYRIEMGAGLDSALFFFQKALLLSEHLHLNSGCGRLESLSRMGEVYFAENSESTIAEGKDCFTKVLSYYQVKGDKDGEAGTLFDFGKVVATFNVTQGLIYYQMALDIYHKTNNTEKEINIRCHISAVHHTEGQDSLAEKELLQLTDEYRNANFTGLDEAYFLLAAINRYRGNLNKSLAYCLKSIELMKKVNDSVNAHRFYGELAQIYQE